MALESSLYPPRDRSTNIGLIKALRDARDQKTFEAADENIARHLHPSLFAELDMMEMQAPNSVRLVNGVFNAHLPAIIAQRREDFDLPDEDLQWEVSANIGFYRALEDEEDRPLNQLGEQLSQRIRTCIQNVQPDRAGAIAHACGEERPRIHRVFSGIDDPVWILQLIDMEIRNALAKTLDHVTSRIRAKQFLRDIGGQFPRLGSRSIASAGEMKALFAELSDLEAAAGRFSVFRLAAVCRVLREVLGEREPTELKAYNGELAVGYGPCGNCAMMYASGGVISYDPTCPGLFDADDGRIYFSYDFNVSVCPFCGEELRAEMPAMFYSPHRNQVIYNFPRLGQFTEDEARAQHRPLISEIRQRYINRIGEEEARNFETAAEEFTYDCLEFLMAIQMGTTVKEEHVYTVVRYHDGSGEILDTTKGAFIGLTRTEMQTFWEAGRTVDLDTARKDEGLGGGPRVKKAMEAFAAGDYERSRTLLEKLLNEYPEDDVVRKNLAVAYLTLGDKNKARNVLKG